MKGERIQTETYEVPESDMATSRDNRNKAVIIRFYYYSDMLKLRYDYVIETLANKEFFLSTRTIINIIIDEANKSYLDQLRATKPGVKKLQVLLPGFKF